MRESARVSVSVRVRECGTRIYFGIVGEQLLWFFPIGVLPSQVLVQLMVNMTTRNQMCHVLRRALGEHTTANDSAGPTTDAELFAFLTEILRVDCALMRTPRRVKENTSICDIDKNPPLPMHSVVLVLLGCANCDPTEFGTPDMWRFRSHSEQAAPDGEGQVLDEEFRREAEVQLARREAGEEQLARGEAEVALYEDVLHFNWRHSARYGDVSRTSKTLKKLLTFGDGSHNCLGQTVVLAEMLCLMRGVLRLSKRLDSLKKGDGLSLIADAGSKVAHVDVGNFGYEQLWVGRRSVLEEEYCSG